MLQIVANFPNVGTVRFIEPGGFLRRQEGGNDARDLFDSELTRTCTQDTNNFAPNESERLSISPALLFTKVKCKRK